MSPWKVIAATLVIFITGAITGGSLVTYAYRAFHVETPAPSVAVASPAQAPSATPWQVRMQNLLRRMDRELSLTPEQHAQMEKVIITGQDRTRNLWQPITPQMNREFQRVHQEIRGMLTPDQRRKFDGISRPGRGNFSPGPVNASRQPGATNLPSDNPTNSPSPAALLQK